MMMTRRVLRVLVEVEGLAFDPDDANPYAETQAELEAILESNLQVISSMDAGDVVTLRDTNGNRCGKVEMEDFPGDDPLLPHWTRLSDLALDVEEEFPVAAFIEKATHPLYRMGEDNNLVPVEQPKRLPEPGGQKGPAQEPKVTYNDEDAARAFDEGELAYPGEPSSHEHIAKPDPGDPVIPPRPRRGSTITRETPDAQVPPPPGDPGMTR